MSKRSPFDSVEEAAASPAVVLGSHRLHRDLVLLELRDQRSGGTDSVTDHFRGLMLPDKLDEARDDPARASALLNRLDMRQTVLANTGRRNGGCGPRGRN